MTDITSSGKRKAEDDPDLEQPEATRTKLDEENITSNSAAADEVAAPPDVTDEQTSAADNDNPNKEEEAETTTVTTNHEDDAAVTEAPINEEEVEAAPTSKDKQEEKEEKKDTNDSPKKDTTPEAEDAKETKADDTNNNNAQPSETTNEIATEKPSEEEAKVTTNENEAPAPAEEAATTKKKEVEKSAAAPSDAAKSESSNNNANEYVEETEKLPRQFVGRVIGRGGEMIRDLQARAGCRIDLDQRNIPKDQPVIINYRGTRTAIDFAKSLIALLCKADGTMSSDLDLPLGSAMRKQINVPSNVIGKVIGRGGEMIREIQNRSGSKVNVEHTSVSNSSDGTSQRRVQVTGTVESVQKAEDMIHFIIQNPMMDTMTALNMMGTNGGGSGMNQQQHYYGASSRGAYGQQGPPPRSGGGGGMEHEIFPTQRQFIGRIVGKKGVTIKDLQSRSGCEIQINQEESLGEQCHVTIKGPRGGVEMVKGMITEIIEMGPNHPYAGGGSRSQAPPSSSYGQHQQPPMGYGGNMYPPHYGMGMPQQPQQPYYGGGGPPMQMQMQQNMMPPQPMMQQQYHAQPQYQPSQQTQQHPSMNMAPQYDYGTQYASMPPPPPPPSPWKSAKASDGKVYYYNETTGETQWDKPVGFVE